ncbi:sugar transferase [Priestia aryabhattai]|uniref:sugar transferase n=1 Tax=Priestia aryabhattai TaxID=412384 RepID=UPI0009B8FCFD|nr:sugar transferase [Priestia aryabhattai]
MFFKRVIDITGSIIGLLLCLPIFLIVPLIYSFGDSKGPVYFKQRRIGRNGEIFYIYKFRSMVIDAEEKLKANKLLYEKYIANNYKLEQNEDPRITSIGRFLRKTSLDELPQFINVLKGEMSLIGPRPVIESELGEYGEKADLFLSVKPGLTGFWQISGRSDVGYPERVDLELYYVYNQNFYFDLKIIIMTIYTVILKRGAY